VYLYLIKICALLIYYIIKQLVGWTAVLAGLDDRSCLVGWTAVDWAAVFDGLGNCAW
jgi:hypothetical protein